MASKNKPPIDKRRRGKNWKGRLLMKWVPDRVYEESAKCFIKQRPFKKGERPRLIASFHFDVEHNDICGCTPEGYTLHDVLQSAEAGDR